MKNIAVFFGGQSIEREISIITGTLTLNSLDVKKYNPIPVYVSDDGKWYTGEILKDVDAYKNLNYKKLTRVTLGFGDNCLYKVKGKRLVRLLDIAVIINCMHGERGEDGSLAGLAKMGNIAFASPNQLCSSVCMSKSATKIFLKGLNVKTLPYTQVKNLSDYELIENKLEYPVIVKPDTGGSSIGICKVDTPKDLKYALSNALRYGASAIVEPFMDGVTEINCAVYQTGKTCNVSQCERPVSRGEILSFSDKYKCGERVFPADIPDYIAEKIRKIAKKIYQSLDFSGVIRIDFMLDGEKVYVNEINTVPGSLAYYLFGEKLGDFTVMLNQLIEDAESRFAEESTFKRSFNSGILHGLGAKGSKRLKNN